MQVLYAVALVPAGFLADRTDRPRMLAGGLGVWSLLTMAASKVSTACNELHIQAIKLQGEGRVSLRSWFRAIAYSSTLRHARSWVPL